MDEVHAAVSWALAHDLPALLAYRHDTHLDRRSRWKADATLVAHWQKATGAAQSQSFSATQAQERASLCPS
jgi:hypothetical protein